VIFLFSKTSRPAVNHTQPPVPWLQGWGLFTSSTKVKNEWSYICNPLTSLQGWTELHSYLYVNSPCLTWNFATYCELALDQEINTNCKTGLWTSNERNVTKTGAPYHLIRLELFHVLRLDCCDGCMMIVWILT